MTTPSDKFEWEYNVRLNVEGSLFFTVWADDKQDARERAFDEVDALLPAWCHVEVEQVVKADPPSMRFFLRNIERTEGDDE